MVKRALPHLDARAPPHASGDEASGIVIGVSPFIGHGENAAGAEPGNNLLDFRDCGPQIAKQLLVGNSTRNMVGKEDGTSAGDPQGELGLLAADLGISAA